MQIAVSGGISTLEEHEIPSQPLSVPATVTPLPVKPVTGGQAETITYLKAVAARRK